jgi:hypothetical protein
MFVIPMPAWVLGVLMVLADMLGGIGATAGQNIAYEVHLAGAAFAFLYYRQRWNFGRLLPGRLSWPWLRSRPSLRIHQPGADKPDSESENREQEVDRILEKIHREGEGSLTRKERRTLETASREYQKRRGVK